MEDVLARTLVRQLRWLNFIVTFFGLLIITALIIGGLLIYRVVTEIHKAQSSISNLPLQPNTTQQLCNSQAGSYLKNYTSACQ